MSDLARYIPPSPGELDQIWQLAERIAKTDFVSRDMRGKPEAVLACMLTGREMGLGPMQSLRDIYLINGKPGMAATLMVDKVRARGHRFATLSNDDQGATVQIHRRGEPRPEPPISFTADDARRANLAGKDTYKQYPARMYWARAASAACRRDAPEALGGAMYTPEELEDGPPQTTATFDGMVADRVTGAVVETSGAGEREASKGKAGTDRHDPAPDSQEVAPQPGADSPRAGGAPPRGVTVRDLARASGVGISEAIQRLNERLGNVADFGPVTSSTPLLGDVEREARAILKGGGG